MPQTVRSADHITQRRRLRLGAVGVGLLAVCGAWGLVALLHLGQLWLANLWLLAVLIIGGAWALAIVVTLVTAVVLWRVLGGTWTASTLVLSLLAPATILVVDWNWLFAHGFYQVNRGDFAAVVSLVRDGGAYSDEYRSGDSGDYYGQRLPSELRHLSVTGRVARLDNPGGFAPVFLPVMVGIPDGGVGYAYLGEAPLDSTYDCFADHCRVGWSLGDGWYWLG